MDALLLSRLQFAFTISFHIIFPAFTIGLSAFIATLLVLWRRTGREHYHRLARFWTKIFAVSFAMGVVSGIAMSYQFGTNWSGFSTAAGNVVGPLIGYEVLTAFFLEATFLGIMLFGWQRVPPWLHVTAAVLVAVGTALSGFWILAANSWMHTPAGHEVIDGVAFPVDWLAIIFNPSFPYRFLHMMNAAYLTTSVVVLAVGARYLLARVYELEARTMLRMGVGMVALAAPMQLLIGDLHGLNTLEHQPVKVAAMEAHWGGEEGPVDFVVFAWPDETSEANRWALNIPYLGSLILTHTWEGAVPGLRDFPPEARPPVPVVFFSFRVMLTIGMLLIVLGIAGAILWWRGLLFDSRRFLRLLSHSWPLGFIAILAGWITTEVGRQPWLVQDLLLTRDAASPVAAGAVAASLAAFVLIYTVVFSIGIYYINRLINRGPAPPSLEPGTPPQGLPNLPLSTVRQQMRDLRQRQPAP